MDFNEIVTSQRRKESTVSQKFHRNLVEEMASDHSRIIYSSPFRRLSKKAQVFPLESNAAVRNRITHSLEVSDVGRLIAYAVTKSLIEQNLLKPELQLPIIYAVENACLIHDIGNPPFGHFGEIAIQEWFKDNWAKCFSGSNGCTEEEAKTNKQISELIKDFLQFDGNPQGLRILLRLQTDKEKDVDEQSGEFSLNLTYTTLLSFIKYTRSPLEEPGDGLKKKPGYFQSECQIIEGMKKTLGLDKDSRYPLAYIMEAADDIAYCISDIEDGIEKKVLTEDGFFAELKHQWGELTNNQPNDFPLGVIDAENPDFFAFKISYTQSAIKKATDYFLVNKDDIFKGKIASIFPEGSNEALAFKCLKKVAKKKLFRSREAENPELAGHQIVSGLLEKFKPLLCCSEDNFRSLQETYKSPEMIKGKGLDIHWRLFNRLPPKHLAAYCNQIKEFEGKNFPEWYFRAHLIVDYISGMTDVFALEQYQLLSGIRIVQE